MAFCDKRCKYIRRLFFGPGHCVYTGYISISTVNLCQLYFNKTLTDDDHSTSVIVVVFFLIIILSLLIYFYAILVLFPADSSAGTRSAKEPWEQCQNVNTEAPILLSVRDDPWATYAKPR